MLSGADGKPAGSIKFHCVGGMGPLFDNQATSVPSVGVSGVFALDEHTLADRQGKLGPAGGVRRLPLAEESLAVGFLLLSPRAPPCRPDAGVAILIQGGRELERVAERPTIQDLCGREVGDRVGSVPVGHEGEQVPIHVERAGWAGVVAEHSLR